MLQFREYIIIGKNGGQFGFSINSPDQSNHGHLENLRGRIKCSLLYIDTVYHLTRHLFITPQMLLSVTVIHPCANVNVMIKGEYFKQKI